MSETVIEKKRCEKVCENISQNGALVRVGDFVKQHSDLSITRELMLEVISLDNEIKLVFCPDAEDFGEVDGIQFSIDWEKNQKIDEELISDQVETLGLSRNCSFSNFTSDELGLLKKLVDNHEGEGGSFEKKLCSKIKSIKIAKQKYGQISLNRLEINILKAWLTSNGHEKLIMKLLLDFKKSLDLTATRTKSFKKLNFYYQLSKDSNNTLFFTLSHKVLEAWKNDSYLISGLRFKGFSNTLLGWPCSGKNFFISSFYSNNEKGDKALIDDVELPFENLFILKEYCQKIINFIQMPEQYKLLFRQYREKVRRIYEKAGKNGLSSDLDCVLSNSFLNELMKDHGYLKSTEDYNLCDRRNYFDLCDRWKKKYDLPSSKVDVACASGELGAYYYLGERMDFMSLSISSHKNPRNLEYSCRYEGLERLPKTGNYGLFELLNKSNFEWDGDFMYFPYDFEPTDLESWFGRERTTCFGKLIGEGRLFQKNTEGEYIVNKSKIVFLLDEIENYERKYFSKKSTNKSKPRGSTRFNKLVVFHLHEMFCRKGKSLGAQDSYRYLIDYDHKSRDSNLADVLWEKLVGSNVTDWIVSGDEAVIHWRSSTDNNKRFERGSFDTSQRLCKFRESFKEKKIHEFFSQYQQDILDVQSAK